jgi:hypothetical protein
VRSSQPRHDSLRPLQPHFISPTLLRAPVAATDGAPWPTCRGSADTCPQTIALRQVFVGPFPAPVDNNPHGLLGLVAAYQLLSPSPSPPPYAGCDAAAL